VQEGTDYGLVNRLVPPQRSGRSRVEVISCSYLGRSQGIPERYMQAACTILGRDGAQCIAQSTFAGTRWASNQYQYVPHELDAT